MSAPTPPAPSAPKWRQFLASYPKISAALLALLTAGLSALATRYGVDPRVVEVVTEVIKEVPAADDVPAPGTVKRSYGWTRPAATEVPERTFSAPQAVVDHLPQSLHLVSAPTPEVPAPLPFDQGQLGSCGPNSAAALILYTEAKAGKKGQPPPSRLFIYYTTRLLMGTTSQDSGVSNATMFRALSRYGFCDETLWPYSDDSITFRKPPSQAAYTQAASRLVTTASAVPQNLTQMKSCLAAGYPIVFGFTVYPSFESQTVELSGVVPMPSRRDVAQGPIGGHDVLITGYDDRRAAFRFLNSWGPEWGQSGFGWMPYAYAANRSLSGDFWTITQSPR